MMALQCRYNAVPFAVPSPFPVHPVHHAVYDHSNPSTSIFREEKLYNANSDCGHHIKPNVNHVRLRTPCRAGLKDLEFVETL